MSTSITPVAQTNSLFGTGYQFHKFRHDSRPFQPSGNKLLGQFRYKLWSGYFDSVSNGNTFTPISGPVAVAWQANQTTDVAGVRVDASNALTISCAGTPSGWIHCLHAGSRPGDAVSTMSPVKKGDAAFVPRGYIRTNHKSAAPNTRASGKTVNQDKFNFQIIPFTLASADDIWNATTARLMPGIQAVAWQGNLPSALAADQCAVTLDANGDVLFTGGATGGNGWLWVWRDRV